MTTPDALAANHFPDELETTVAAIVDARPGVAAAIADAEQLQALLDELVRLRKASGLTQTDVAKQMGVRQPTVSQFETESSDPRVSTLQRYARAVGTMIGFQVGEQHTVSDSYVNISGGARVTSMQVRLTTATLSRRWSASRQGNNVIQLRPTG